MARQIFLKHKSETTPVGIVKNIGREGEEVILTTLKDMNIELIDMFTTVYIGNRETFIRDGKMVTPRGYLEKKGKKK